MTTKIEWTDETWNPVTGCTKISPGCANCYAARMANRLVHIESSGYGESVNTPSGQIIDPSTSFKVILRPERIGQPLKWKKPRNIFVCSMGDLFHKDVPFEFIQRVWAEMALANQHTYQVLTKRPERILEYLNWIKDRQSKGELTVEFSLRNVWLGVTAENQEQANKRIPLLLQAPAAVRFVSCEPLLGPLDLTRVKDQDGDTIDSLNGCYYSTDGSGSYIECERLDWLIVGGESGPGARPMHPDWAKSIRDQCFTAGVPYFFKQWGEFVDPYQAQIPPSDYEKKPYITVNSMYRNQGVPNINLHRVGKKKAGRLLDGRVWNEFPGRSY